MRSFRTEFDDLFMEGFISAVEIGLGASGELKYPSFSERMGWRYPGIGEFQVSFKLVLLTLFVSISRQLGIVSMLENRKKMTVVQLLHWAI